MAPRRPRWVMALAVCDMLALGLWIGGLTVIVAAVIPAVFNSFGMEPGGRFLTRVFDGYNRLIVIAAGVLIVTVAVRGALGRSWPGFRPSVWEWSLTTLMTVLVVLIVFVLGPHSVALQDRAFVEKDEAARKAAYEAFFKSHRVVRGLYVITVLLGVALVPIKLNAWMPRQRMTA